MSERLAKMVMMLSSDNDGEVLAAARAIGRALKEQGRDWHALAALVRGMGEPAPATRFSHFATPPKSTGGSSTFGVTPNMRAMIEMLNMRLHSLTVDEATFVRNYHHLCASGRPVFMSMMQQARMCRIYAAHFGKKEKT